jgi:hypothetical protein
MDANMLTSVISKLMVVNENCLIVDTCIIGPGGVQTSLVVNLFYNSPLLGENQPKPIFQLRSKVVFGNADVCIMFYSL